MLEDESLKTGAVRGVTHGAVVVANDGLGDERGEVVVVLPADTLDSDGNVGGGDGVVTETDLGTDEVREALLVLDESLGLGAWWLAWEAREVLLGQLNHLLVSDATGANKDHTVSSVVLLDVAGEVVARYRLNVLLGAENCLSQRLALESGCVKVVENDLAQVLVNLLLFPQDYITFALDSRVLELGVLQDIAEDANGGRDVRVEGLGVVDSVFALYESVHVPLQHIQHTYRGVSVQVTAHVLNLQFELVLCPAASALEGQVLQEMRSAIDLVCSGTSIDPDTDCRSLGPGRVLGGNCETVRQGGRFCCSSMADRSSQTTTGRSQCGQGLLRSKSLWQAGDESTRRHCDVVTGKKRRVGGFVWADLRWTKKSNLRFDARMSSGSSRKGLARDACNAPAAIGEPRQKRTAATTPALPAHYRPRPRLRTLLLLPHVGVFLPFNC